MIRDCDIHIRAMTSQDFYLMVRWLNNQKVLEFYEEPLSNLDEVVHTYGPRIKGEHRVTSCIVEY